MLAEVNLTNKILYKIHLYLLKIIPMIMAFICILNTILSYFDLDIVFLSYLGSCSILMLVYLYVSSYVFKFCEYHRMFLHYIVVATGFNTYDYYVGIPLNDLHLFMVYQIITGMFLFLTLYFYVKSHKKSAVKNNRRH